MSIFKVSCDVLLLSKIQFGFGKSLNVKTMVLVYILVCENSAAVF